MGLKNGLVTVRDMVRGAGMGVAGRLEEGELGRGSSAGEEILRRDLGSGGLRTGLLLRVLAGISERKVLSLADWAVREEIEVAIRGWPGEPSRRSVG